MIVDKLLKWDDDKDEREIDGVLKFYGVYILKNVLQYILWNRSTLPFGFRPGTVESK